MQRRVALCRGSKAACRTPLLLFHFNLFWQSLHVAVPAPLFFSKCFHTDDELADVSSIAKTGYFSYLGLFSSCASGTNNSNNETKFEHRWTNTFIRIFDLFVSPLLFLKDKQCRRSLPLLQQMNQTDPRNCLSWKRFSGNSALRFFSQILQFGKAEEAHITLCKSRMYSLVQRNWLSDVTGCTWVTCIQWRQRTNFTAPGCIMCLPVIVLSFHFFFFIWQDQMLRERRVILPSWKLTKRSLPLEKALTCTQANYSSFPCIVFVSLSNFHQNARRKSLCE